jgi:hypothetical protein
MWNDVMGCTRPPLIPGHSPRSRPPSPHRPTLLDGRGMTTQLKGEKAEPTPPHSRLISCPLEVASERDFA